MMRWLFILLLLVNAVYLGWQLSKPAAQNQHDLPTDVARIRLLSEIDASLLLARAKPDEGEQRAGQQDPNAAWCQRVSGITEAKEADDLVAQLAGQNINAYIEPLDEERVLAYELTVDMPVSESQQDVLRADLNKQGFTAEPARLNRRDVYILGRYPTRTALNQARSGLDGGFDTGIYQLVSQANQYIVWIEVEGDIREAFKNKGLDGYFSKSLKFEKKLCKGVASTGVRE